MSKKRLIILKNKKISLDGVSIRAYEKGDMIDIEGAFADNLIAGNLAKEWRAKRSAKKGHQPDPDPDIDPSNNKKAGTNVPS